MKTHLKFHTDEKPILKHCDFEKKQSGNDITPKIMDFLKIELEETTDETVDDPLPIQTADDE